MYFHFSFLKTKRTKQTQMENEKNGLAPLIETIYRNGVVIHLTHRPIVGSDCTELPYFRTDHQVVLWHFERQGTSRPYGMVHERMDFQSNNNNNVHTRASIQEEIDKEKEKEKKNKKNQKEQHKQQQRQQRQQSKSYKK